MRGGKKDQNLHIPLILRQHCIPSALTTPHTHTQLSDHFNRVCLALDSSHLLCSASLLWQNPTVPPWHPKPRAQTLGLLRPKEHLPARTSALAQLIVCVGSEYKAGHSRVCSTIFD